MFLLQILRKVKNYSEEVVKQIESCWKPESDERAEWNFVTSTLYGFGIVTTLGYNRIAPITLAGRIFCILYGLCGIPVTMITIANVGRYMNTFAKSCKQKIEKFRVHYWNRKTKLKNKTHQDDNGNNNNDDNDDKNEESSTGFASLVLVAAFLVYVAFGALLLPLLNGETDFINGLYYNFLCLTAIDFGQLVPQRVAFLPITFMYVCIGLAITTIAIDVGSEYVRKLHYVGQKMKNVASTRIWFGGKTLKVLDLLHEVGNKCGVEASVIDKMDLDNVIEQAIARNEGRQQLPLKHEDIISTNEPISELLSPEQQSIAAHPIEMYPLLSRSKIRSRSNAQSNNLASLML
ncbi:unnamed protein product [Thelazia callipaeda]|uniref:Potassium channel domain-containing protein n=1 Tax=Thelazia callipaeda TaxID=103827 RepID=A0A3P7K6S6_THECL|nr:unnamed protein product [Thelazia callipaeda]